MKTDKHKEQKKKIFEGKDDLRIAHGKTSHKYGEPCELCNIVHADNPYVKRLISTAEQRGREEVIEEVKRIFVKSNTPGEIKLILNSLKKLKNQ